MKQNHRIKKRSKLFTSLMVAMSGVASAATIDVDGNTCTLIDAIESANTDAAVNGCTAGSGNDVIRLVSTNGNGGIPSTHLLSGQHVPSTAFGGTYVGTPIIITHITIEGEGQVIQAIPNPDPFRVFEVGSGGTLIMNNVTVTGGNDGVGVGSAVLNYTGSLEINESTLYSNKGAIASVYGPVTINKSSIINNSSDNPDWPSALFSYVSLVTVNDSSFVNNRMLNLPPLLGESRYKLRRQNKGSGYVPPATIQLNDSESILVNSTISGNESVVGAIGAGQELPPPPRMSGFKRTKQLKGGGLSLGTTLSHLTITDNKGYTGGIYISPGHQATMEGSILSGNTSLLDPAIDNGYIDDPASLAMDAHNFVGANGQSGADGMVLGASDVVFSNATSDNLYPLNLSNHVFVHPLKHGSAAIDGLAKSCFQGLFLDQEGKGRGIDGDGNGSFICDAGAFEHSMPITVSGGCTLHNALVSANNDVSIGGCQPGNGHDIIELPQGSTHTGTAIVDNYQIAGSLILYSGLPVIRSGLVINGNGATIERDTSSLEDFNMITVADRNGLILNDTTVTGASASLSAVASWYGSEIQVFNSTITGNDTVGVLSVLNHISSIKDSSITNNNGDDYFSHLASGIVAYISNSFELKNSLVANNTATQLGAIQFTQNSNLVVSNNTISGNVGGGVGGVVSQNSSGLFTHNTITNNSGSFTGGVYDAQSVGTLFSHNIISGNVITPPPPPAPALANNSLFGRMVKPIQTRGGTSYEELVVANPVTFSTRHNVLGQNALSGTNGFTLDASDIVPAGAVNTVIDTNLADNGGMTMSHLPAVGSVAIDAGEPFNCESNTRDQRNFIRPWDGDNDGDDRCDIGSVEAESVAYTDLIFKDGFDPEIILP